MYGTGVTDVLQQRCPGKLDRARPSRRRAVPAIRQIYVFDCGTGEYNYRSLVTTTPYPWGRPLAGSQYQYWDRPRRSVLVSLVMVAEVLVDDTPQPGIARVAGQHRLAVTPNRFGLTLISTSGLPFRL